MKIKTTKSAKIKDGMLFAPIFEEDLGKIPAIYPQAVKDFVKARVKIDKYTAKFKSTRSTYLTEKDLTGKMTLLGLGSKKKFTSDLARYIGGQLGTNIKSAKLTKVHIVISKELISFLEPFLEGLLISQYDVGLHKTAKKSKKALSQVILITSQSGKEVEEQIQKAQIITEAINFVKDLVNSPANIVDSEKMAAEARRIAKENRYKKAILGKKELTKIKAGGILAVNQGCNRDPKLLVLEHQGAKNKKEAPIILIGKGVIFDTGGYNLKHTGHMETMHQDMAGGATVLGVMSIVKKLGIKKNVVGVVPVVENLVNENAYRPSDVITMLSGNTVEITNTDAEGRLILADAIHYATEMKPAKMVTIATLTGAVAVALGNRYCGLMGNDDHFRENLLAAGKAVDDPAWALPLHEDYSKEMDSRVADFRNYDRGGSKGGGTVKAACFLEKFVKNNPWCHLDIGGTAFTTHPLPYQTRGATAHGLRMLIEFLEKEGNS